MLKDLGVLNKESKADRLYHMSFKNAAIVIEKMDDMEKAEVAAEINALLEPMNEKMCLIDQYTMEDGYPRALCSMEEYNFLMSKTKRYEILLNYLYKINDMLEEAELKALIEEFEQQDTLDERDAAKLDSYMMDIKVVAKASVRTNNIVNKAAELTRRYFK